MQKKLLSITRKQDFHNVKLHGEKLVSRFAIMRYIKDKENSNNVIKLGLIVTKKHGNAVIRNKIRRRMKVIVKEALKSGLFADYNLMLVIIPKYMNESPKFTYLKMDITNALQAFNSHN